MLKGPFEDLFKNTGLSKCTIRWASGQANMYFNKLLHKEPIYPRGEFGL